MCKPTHILTHDSRKQAKECPVRYDQMHLCAHQDNVKKMNPGFQDINEDTWVSVLPLTP